MSGSSPDHPVPATEPGGNRHDSPTGTAVGLAPGLCSVTFRRLAVPEVVALAAAAGLAGIEWGGDGHVPPGDRAAAADAARHTTGGGLRVASYGSYLFAEPGSIAGIGPVLDTAEVLGTDLVRVWCPFGVEPGATDGARAEVATVLATWAGAAAARGITLYLEYHGGTLTATAASTLDLLEAVGADNLTTAWQPAYWRTEGTGRDQATHRAELADLAALGPWLAHVHVYEWDGDLTRRPLATGAGHWPAALAAATEGRAGLDRFALIEFVAGDDPAVLAAEAATLRRWLAA
jgi:3-dehydroshikimate dehydratase